MKIRVSLKSSLILIHSSLWVPQSMFTVLFSTIIHPRQKEMEADALSDLESVFSQGVADSSAQQGL